MKNEKGFTLIELLAVIVILALIAIIAVPVVLNLINNARRSSARTSSLNFVDAIEYYAGFSEINNTGIAMEKYSEKVPKATKTVGTNTVSSNVTCIYNGSTWVTSVESGATLSNENQTCDKFFGTRDGNGVVARSRGKIPEEASIILDYKGKVQNNSWLVYNNYKCNYNGLDIPECVKN